jgi:hypothetical protein
MNNISHILVVIFAISIFPLLVYGQLQTPPKIEWQRSLGGSGDEFARSIQQTSDGGYIVAGYSNSFDGDVNKTNNAFDYLVVKLLSSGMTEWKRLYGGNGDDLSLSIKEITHGSYIIAGSSYSNDVDVKDHIGTGNTSDFWVVKLTDDSVVNWERSLGGMSSDWGASIIPTFDTGYIVVGGSRSTEGMVVGNHGIHDCWVVKLASNGIKEWSKLYGGSGDDYGFSIKQTADSGYIIAGYNSSSDGNITGHHGSETIGDYWVIKLSKEGDMQWQSSLGGSQEDCANDILQTGDGGYIVMGYSRSTDGDVNMHHGSEATQDIWVVKLTDSGSIEWGRSLGGTDSEVAQSVCEMSDGGYVIAGYTFSYDGNVSFNHGGSDGWLVKLSDSGILEWEKSIGGSNDDVAYSVEQTTDGGFIVAGYSGSNDGDVSGNHGASDYWIVKLSPEGTSSVEFESIITRNISISPNPASSSATLTLESDEVGACEVQIISVAGATLKKYSTHLAAGKQDIDLTGLESLPAGMYEVLLKQGYKMQRTKLILQR